MNRLAFGRLIANAEISTAPFAVSYAPVPRESCGVPAFSAVVANPYMRAIAHSVGAGCSRKVDHR